MQMIFADGWAEKAATVLRPLVLVMALAACGQKTPEELWDVSQTAISEGDYRTATIHLKNIVQQDTDNLDALLLLGDVALAGGDAQFAEIQYRRMAEKGATSARMRLGLLEALLELGKYRELLEEADPASIESVPDRARMLALRGRANAGLGRFPDAEQDYRKALELRPEVPEFHLYLAEVYRRSGRDEEAMSEIAEVLEIDPDHPAPKLWEGERALSREETSAAEAAFIHAARAAGQRFSEQRFSPQRESFKIRVAALYQLADLQLSESRLDDAAATISTLSEIWPEHLLVKFLDARLAAQSGDLDSAQSQLQDILAGQSDFRPAQRLLGVVYGLKGNLDLADMYLKPYLNTYPDDDFTRQMLVRVRLAQQRPDEALALLEGTTGEVNPEARQQLLAMAGESALKAGDLNMALQYFRTGADAFPSDPRFDIGQAAAMLADGQVDESIELLEIVDAAPDTFQKSALLVVAYLRDDQIDAAQSLATKMIEDYPDRAAAHNLLGTLYLASDLPDQAYAHVRHALDIEAKNIYALANLARIEQRRGNGESAKQALKQMIEVDPDNGWARLNLARLELASGRREVALDLVRPIQEDFPNAQLLVGSVELDRGNRLEARKIGRNIARTDPSNAGAHALLGLIDLEEGAYESAVRHFETATRIEPNSFGFQLNLSRGYLGAGDQEGARAAITKARSMNPNSPQLAVVEIALFTRDGDYLRAERLLENLEKNGFNPVLRLMLLGELRDAQRRYADAAAVYSAAYAVRPNRRLAVRTLRAGWAAGLTEPPEPAEDWVDLNPDDTVVLKALATWHLGRDQLEMAQQYLERLVKIDRNDPVALNDLAWIYQQTGDGRALRTAQRAYALLPANAAIADTLGWIQLEAGNIESALELLEKAGKSTPPNPEIQYHLAVAYRESGDAESAKRLLTDLIQSDQAFPSREAAEEALASL